MCKHIDEIKNEMGPFAEFHTEPLPSSTLCTDLDEAMGTAFPHEWRTEQQQMAMGPEFLAEQQKMAMKQGAHKLLSEWQDGKRDGNGKPILGGTKGKQTEDGAQTRKKARLEDVEDSQLPCEDEEVTRLTSTPLTEASVNSMNEVYAKQDELMRARRKNIAEQNEAKRKNIAEQDEVLEKKRQGMAPESGKKEEQEVQGRNPQEPKNRNPIPPKNQICMAGRWIDKELATDESKWNAYIEQFAARAKLQYGEQGPNPRLQEQMNPIMIAGEKAKAAVRAEEAQEMEEAKEHGELSKAEAFRVQKKDQARGAAKQAQEMGKATEAKPLGPCLSIDRPDKEVFEKLQKKGLFPKAAETDKKAAETDKKAAEKYSERSKRQLRETRPTLQDLFTFLRISGPSMALSLARWILEMIARGFPCSLAPPLQSPIQC